MLLGAAMLLVALGITLVVNRLETARADPQAAQADRITLGKAGGFELIFKDRYLLWIAVLIVLLNVVNTTGELPAEQADRRRRRSAALGVGRRSAEPCSSSPRFPDRFGATVNLLGFLLQLFVTSRVMRYMGVRGALFILPVLAFVNYSVIAVAPILAVVKLGQDSRERHRLLDPEHGPAGAVPADVARGEVQGQGRHRHVLHANRRRAVGWRSSRSAPRSASRLAGLRLAQRRIRCARGCSWPVRLLENIAGRRCSGRVRADDRQLRRSPELLQHFLGRRPFGRRPGRGIDERPQLRAQRHRQHAVEILHRQAPQRRVRRPDAVVRDLQRLARQDRREQREHVLEVALRRPGLRRASSSSRSTWSIS